MNIRFIRNSKFFSNKWMYFFYIIIQLGLGTLMLNMLFQDFNIDFLQLKGINVSHYLRDRSLVETAFFLISAFVSIAVVYNSLRFAFECENKNEFVANYHYDERKLFIIDAVCNIIYDSKDLFILAIPFIIVGKHYWPGFTLGDQCKILLLVFLILAFRISFTCLFCGGSIKMHRSANQIVKLLLWIKNIIIFCACYGCGRFFSSWVDAFPLVSGDVEAQALMNWFDDGYSQISTFGSLLAQAIECCHHIHIIFFLYVLAALIFFLGLVLSRASSEENTVQDIVHPSFSFRNLYMKMAFGKKNGSLVKGYLMENAVFWLGMGLYLGVLSKIDHLKIFYFICTAFSLYFGLQIAIHLFKNHLSVFCLNGEGKKIIFWLSNVNHLLMQKMKVWFISITSISVIEHILLFLLNGSKYIWVFLLFQIVYLMLLFFVLNIPSVITPYYIYSNINEIEAFADYKKISEMIEPIMLIGVNSILAVPVAMFMTDYISFQLYILLQFIAIPFLLFLFCIVAACIFKNIVNSKQYIAKIFRR